MDANQTSYNLDISIKKESDITSTDITKNVKQQLCPTQIRKELCEEEKPDNAARNIESQMSYQFPRIKMEPLEDGNNTGDEINDVSQQSGILSTIKTEQTSISYSSDGTYFHPDVNLSTIKKELIDVTSEEDNNFEVITSLDTLTTLKGNSQGFKCEGIKSELPAIKPCTCPNCDNFFCEKRKLNNNGLLCHSKIFDCYTCKKQFCTEENLSEHLKYKQINNFCYYCDVCRVGFTSENDFQEHKENRNHRKKLKQCFLTKEYECIKCQKRFLTINGLESHSKVCSGAKLLKCDECKIVFTKSRSLKNHRIREHLKDKYKCSKCRKRFLTGKALEEHSKVCFDQYSEKNFLKCAECNAGFTKLNDFIIHLEKNRIRDKPLECNSCKMKVLYKCHFWRH